MKFLSVARNMAAFVFTGMLFVALLPHGSARADKQENAPWVNVMAPLSGEGFLWAPALRPTASKQISLKFKNSYHGLDYMVDDIEGSVFLLVLTGEYPVFDRLTVGLDVPFLVGYDVASDLDWADDSGVDFGNVRLHLRVDSFAVFEPMLQIAHCKGPLSFAIDMGLKPELLCPKDIK